VYHAASLRYEFGNVFPEFLPRIGQVLKFTIDTNVLADEEVIAKASVSQCDIAIVSVTEREAGSSRFQAVLKSMDGLETIPETLLWYEGGWGNSSWGSPESSEHLKKVLLIITNGSFPNNRENLSDKQKRQLRDALIFQAHINAGRDIFVSNDRKAFINHGKRERLERSFQTKILSSDEFSEYIGNT